MIEIRNLSYRYPDGTLALKDLDLTISDGEFLLICGPNGSGKTTLIRHLNGLLEPSSGTVQVDGLDVVRATNQVRQRVGMVFQEADSQIVGETVEEDVAFGPENLDLDPAEVQQRVSAALEWVALRHLAHKPCHLLSGGEKRRLAIAGVLAMQSRTIVFDEPFANLDYNGIRQVLRQLIILHREGHTIVLSTHDVEKVMAHADKVVILCDGELKFTGLPETALPELSRYGICPPHYETTKGKILSWLTD